MSFSMELLAPAGSPETLKAALEAGADAVYFGGAFSARAYAENFADSLASAVEQCHACGARAHITLNTLLRGRELSDAWRVVRDAASAGADAMIVQDAGLIRLIRRFAPEMELHASTQMALHSADGVRAAADAGFARVVLAREMTEQDIAAAAEAAKESGIELEVFVHGAHCMCNSGQCELSAFLGGRSGNRGRCAQPCRLPWKNGYPLSLRDLCLAGHLTALARLGVASLKIEGRMKGPDYVFSAVSLYRRLLDEGRDARPDEIRRLAQVFSRSGFTDGYFEGKTGRTMFGVRTAADEAATRTAGKAEKQAEKNAGRKVRLTLEAVLRAGEKARLTVSDGRDTAVAEGEIPAAASGAGLKEDEVRARLSRMGGTVYEAGEIRLTLEDGLFMPVSALNALRRAALEALTALRTQKRSVACGSPDFSGESTVLAWPVREPELWISAERPEQLEAAGEAGRYWLDAGRPGGWDGGERGLQQLSPSVRAKLGAVLPRCAMDHDGKAFEALLDRLEKSGIRCVTADGAGELRRARERGFEIHGGTGMNLFNSCALEEAADRGLASVLLSVELSLPQIRDLKKPLPCGLVAAGHLAVMLTENCLLGGPRNDSCGRGRTGGRLEDRRGAAFPVRCAFGHRSELLNAAPLWMGDRRRELCRLGLDHLVLRFTDETPERVRELAGAWRAGKPFPAPKNAGKGPVFTRGLYDRGVL